jgi:hypothetical protein
MKETLGDSFSEKVFHSANIFLECEIEGGRNV